MKSFLGIVEKRNNDRSGNPRDRMTLYRIKRNRLELITRDMHIGYRNDWQAAIEYLRECGELPKNSPKFTYGLREAGIANIDIVTVG